jgi:hypothetical protein
MQRMTFGALALALATLATGPATAEPNKLTDQQKQAGWQTLFNGKNLDGWSVRSGKAKYRVEDDAIVGRTVKGSPNTFLTTDKQFSDFVLKFEVLLNDNALNSGVQIRSKLRGDKYGGRLSGPQVEIEHQNGGESGYIYGEALGTGWLSKARDKHAHFKNQKWNQYRVRAVGNRIQTWINGEKVADLTVPDKVQNNFAKGRIGLQVHGVGNRGPFEVRWRNIYLKKIDQQ